MNILAPRLPASLDSAESLYELFDIADDLDGLNLTNGSAAGLHTKSRSLSDSSIFRFNLSLMDMERFDIANCIIKSCDLSGSKFPDSSWRTVQIDNSRCSGMQVQNSNFKNVRYSNSKLETVNYRFSTIENVIFEDCILDDIDFYAASLKNVTFINCTITKIAFGNAKMKNVDLSKSTIESIEGVGSLKGSTISYDQLLQLAPYFAAEAGINVQY